MFMIKNGGGAIYINKGNCNITKSFFLNNLATGETGKGGAISIGQGNLTLKNSEFVNNTANTTSGGAIYIKGFLNMTYCILLNNIVKSGINNSINVSNILNINNNWWGDNDPFNSNKNLICNSNSDSYITPETWIKFNASLSKDNLNIGDTLSITGKLQEYNSTSGSVSDLEDELPELNVLLSSSKGSLNPEITSFRNNEFLSEYTAKLFGNDVIFAVLNNEKQGLSISINGKPTSLTSGDASFIKNSIGQVSVILKNTNGVLSNQNIHYTLVNGNNIIFKGDVKTDINGVGIINLPEGLDSGFYIVNFNYDGDGLVNLASSTSNSINVYIQPKIIGENVSVNSKEVNFIVSLTGDGKALGDSSVLFIFNDNYYPTVTNELGIASVNLTGLNPGTYTIRTVFHGYAYYLSSSVDNTITVTDITNTVLSFNNYTGKNDTNASLSGKLALNTNQGLSNQNITIRIIDSNKTSSQYSVSTNLNGEYTLNVNLSTGVYDVLVKYSGTSKFNASENIGKIVIKDSKLIDTDLSLNMNLWTAGLKGDLNGILKTSTGQGLSNQTISIKITDTNNTSTEYNVSTDTNGKYVLAMKLKEGVYDILVKFDGTSQYSGSENNSKITIISPRIPVSNLSLNDYNGINGVSGKLTGKLLSSNDDPIVNETIKLLLLNPSNGLSKTYTLTTDTNGEYSLTINLHEGIYIASAIYEGSDEFSESGPVNSTIIINKDNSTPKYSNETITVLSLNKYIGVNGLGENLTGKLSTINGEPIIGQHIALKITRLSDGASKTYHTTTDNKGVYELAINLATGQYSVSASYQGQTIKNITYLSSGYQNGKITIIEPTNKTSTTLIINAYNGLANVKENLTGKLINTYNDTGIIGQHIALNLSNLKNGASKVYWVTTNSTGEYELEINLSTGNYSVQCSYGGTSIYEKSNTSTKFTIS